MKTSCRTTFHYCDTHIWRCRCFFPLYNPHVWQKCFCPPSSLQLRVVLGALLPVLAYQSALPTDCSDVYRAGSGLDGVYTIYPAGPTSPVQVYCDMSKDHMDSSAEKWTVRTRSVSLHGKSLRHEGLGRLWSRQNGCSISAFVSPDQALQQSLH